MTRRGRVGLPCVEEGEEKERERSEGEKRRDLENDITVPAAAVSVVAW